VIFPLVVIAIILFVMVMFRNRDTRLCRWRAQPGKPGEYKCMYCGATARGDPNQPPDLCYDPRKTPPS
jgi:hypothetical protein